MLFDIVFLLLSGQTAECNGTEYRLVNQSSYYDDVVNYYDFGTLEICVNGSYYPSCLDSLPDNICSKLFSGNSGKLAGLGIKFSFLYVVAVCVDNKASVVKVKTAHIYQEL